MDKYGTWMKIRGKFHFGLKKRHITDDEELVFGVVTTTVNFHLREDDFLSSSFKLWTLYS